MRNARFGSNYETGVLMAGSLNGKSLSTNTSSIVCADACLIIELDGGQHAEQRDYDENRTRILEAMGYLVLRFWNNDVLNNTDGVLESIVSTLNEHRSFPPHPDPLPSGEREKKA